MLMIRDLHPARDQAAVRRLYDAVSDYWLLAEGRAPDAAMVADFFTDAPPGCDPAASQRLGLYPPGGGQLGGVAVLSFGFPMAHDAYIDLMLLAPHFRGRGHGAGVVRDLEGRARARGVRGLYLAVLEANPRGWAFWEREGFRATGHSGGDPETGRMLHRLGKVL